MISRKALAAVIGGALLLAGCSDAAESDEVAEVAVKTVEPQTDWVDEDQKLRVFMEHVCWRDGHESTMDSYTQASTVAVAVMADSASSQADKMIAMNIITRPADAYEEDVAWAEAAGEEVPENSVPRTLTPEGGGTCSGWVWEKHLEQAYNKEYESFTFEEARSVGAI